MEVFVNGDDFGDRGAPLHDGVADEAGAEFDGGNREDDGFALQFLLFQQLCSHSSNF